MNNQERTFKSFKNISAGIRSDPYWWRIEGTFVDTLPLIDRRKPQFETGQVLITRKVLNYLTPDLIDALLWEHVASETDTMSSMSLDNDIALRDGGPILHSHRDTETNTVYVVTDADRSRTTVMMEDEFDRMPSPR